MHIRARVVSGALTALSLVLASVLGAVASCGTDATGIDACRQIEQTRCEIIVGCPDSLVNNEVEVEECKLFYRDQCLFGMPEDISPDPVDVEACIAALHLARACWDAGLTLGQCTTPAAADAGIVGPVLAPGVDPNHTGCDAIWLPQRLNACLFLIPGAEPAGPAAGGAGGVDGSTGGAGGSTGGAGGSTGGAGGSTGGAGGSTGGAGGSTGGAGGSTGGTGGSTGGAGGSTGGTGGSAGGAGGLTGGAGGGAGTGGAGGT